METVMQYIGLVALLLSLFNLAYILWNNRFSMSAKIVACALDFDKHLFWLDVICTNRSGLQFSIVSCDYCLKGRPVKCELYREELPSNVAPYEARRLILRFPLTGPEYAFNFQNSEDWPSDAVSDLTVYTSRGKHLQRVEVELTTLSSLKSFGGIR